MVSTYRELDMVCNALGLTKKTAKTGHIWKGIINGDLVVIAIHIHATGRDIKSGLFNKYVKQLGFENEQEYFEFLKKL